VGHFDEVRTATLRAPAAFAPLKTTLHDDY
jgi:hypothetical protein